MEATATNLSLAQTVPPALPPEYVQQRWYAAHTCANHEKRVAEQLARRCVEHLLPLYPSWRRWKDRRVCLQLPLFPGYIFVRLALRDRMLVLQAPSVVRLIGFGATPAPVSENEIASLQRALGEGARLQPHPYLTLGQRVRITTGSLAGYEGILIRRKGNLRVVLSIDLIQRSVVLDTDAHSIAPVRGATHSQVSRFTRLA